MIVRLRLDLSLRETSDSTKALICATVRFLTVAVSDAIEFNVPMEKSDLGRVLSMLTLYGRDLRRKPSVCLAGISISYRYHYFKKRATLTRSTECRIGAPIGANTETEPGSKIAAAELSGDMIKT